MSKYILAAVLALTSLQAHAIDQEVYEKLDIFAHVLEKIRTSYVEEVTETEVIENAINGMLTSLDPHSAYLSNTDFQDLREQTRGEFGGLGIEVTMENGLVKVVSPIEDTPAEKAGLEAKDLIVKIDGDAPLFRLNPSNLSLLKMKTTPPKALATCALHPLTTIPTAPCKSTSVN